MMRRIYRYISNLSIKYKLLLSYLALVLIPLLMFLFINTFVTQRENEKDVIYSAQQVLDQTTAFLEFKTQSAVNSLNVIALNNTVQEMIQKESELYSDNIGRWLVDSAALSEVFQISKINPDISGIHLYMKEGLATLSQNDDFLDLNKHKDSKWYHRFTLEKNNILWFGKDYFPQINGEDYIHVLRNIPSTENLQESIGFVRLSFPENTFQSILNNSIFTKSTTVVLINQLNEVICSSDNYIPYDIEIFPDILSEFKSNNLDSGVLKPLYLNEKKTLIGVQNIYNSDWKVLLITPYTDILSLSKKSQSPMILIFVIIAVFTLPFSFLAASSAVKRIKALIVQMRRVVKGDYSATIVPDRNDEIGELTSNFNYMLKEISKNINEKYLLGKEMKNLELRALQAQINPHFLYNTLDMINWMSIRNKVPEIGAAVEALSKFYKLSLSKGEDTITIRDEIEHVKVYMQIQNMRFENSVQLEINVPDEVLDYYIIKIVLQPIIENSILHGILEKDEEKGTIRIWCETSHNTITFHIQDDGVGMSEQLISQLRLGMINPQKRSGYGLKNINERLKLNYGNEFGLSFESEAGIGTTISIKLPIIGF